MPVHKTRTRLLSVLILLGSSVAHGAPPAVLIFGGGWGPEGTQASIEAHVEALAAALAPTKPEVLFAGPDPEARSVQVRAARPDEVGAFLGLLFGDSTGIEVDYQTPRFIPRGPATEDTLLDALRRGASDPRGLVVFGVGHGQLLGEEPKRESGLVLWGSRDGLPASKLAQALDAAPRRGPLAFVLGQCHSGGFSDLGFVGRHPKRRLASPARCVLAAVPEDRPASGCTSDLTDASARAFMALVAEAFVRTTEADLDGDRAVSLAEAFTYARVHDRTVNVPVRSSEAFLRHVGKRPRRAPARSVLLRLANPEERAVIEALAPKLEVEDVRRRFEALEEERTRRGEELDRRLQATDEARAKVQDLLFERWPELTGRFHAVSRGLLAGEATELRVFLSGRPEFEALRSASEAAMTEESELEELERESAILERWLRATENVLYEREVNKNSVHRRQLAALRACEAQTPLGAAPSPGR